MFKENKAMIEKDDDQFVIASLNDKGQYESDFIPVVNTVYTAELNANLWYRRMGDSSNKVLQKLGLPSNVENFL